MIKVFEMIQNYTKLFLRGGPVCAQRKMLELLLNYHKIKNIVNEHYQWVTGKMLFREECKPKLFKLKEFLDWSL